MIKANKDQLLIGLIGDTHIPSNFPDILYHIIDDFKEKNIDYLFHVGDLQTIKYIENFKIFLVRKSLSELLGIWMTQKYRKNCLKK